MSWIAVEQEHTITANAERTFVLAVDAVSLVARGLAYQLHAQDLAELQPEDGDVRLVANTAHCIFIELSAHPACDRTSR
jgi:hypothetical protein